MAGAAYRERISLGQLSGWVTSLLVVLIFGSALARADTSAVSASLDEQIGDLSSEVAALGRDVFALEEQLVYPADTRIEVYVSLSDKVGLQLDSLALSVDGEPVTSHIYSSAERDSLREGGVQRLYTGRLPLGLHTLTATLTAQAADDRFVRREARYRFHKRRDASRLELKLSSSPPKSEPVISFREWH
ncbi:MAG: AraC family transcriptional regulator [Gammaproteobacteria bacterium]|nr:MAG: AraC family transcriptional regulator [Gammaproteobacteria bacterium]